MKVNVVHEGETYVLQCGTGMQRVAWVARVAAQRLGSEGVWCPSDGEVGKPKEFIPGRVFYPDGDEMDTEATIASLVDAAGNKDDADLTLVVELREKPSHGLPSLAARGSEDSVVPPKNSKAAASYHVSRGVRGSVVKRTPAPMPPDHEGHNFDEVYDQIDISDLSKGSDGMILAAVRNVLMNNFASLVDIFVHYARPRQSQGLESEGSELAVNMKQLATFVRTCRLSNENCSFFEIQRACVRPGLLLPQQEEEWSLGIYDADFRLFEFFEALIRIANLKNFGLSATCDQFNKLVHTQILPYATGDDEDRIREMTQEVKVQAVFFHQRNGLKKFFSRRMKLEKPSGARSISLKEFIECLKASEQADDELTPAAVKEIWLATLSFDVRPDLIGEDDTTLEVSLSEFEEVITRCVLQKSKVAEENLSNQTDLFIKRFLRSNP
uniref:Uncharacterized protein n=1 Tax=Hemiselmis tepida TaxID=464990 RepID=A0A7S0Z2A6_9CRYP|mmetsp:Transcript_38857/g.99262  ORF Transcript_38857/g.99262 Transcript_38857/m.99262 type:complete len:440 (+) Transcript_38857:25-1344(+)|eukprot:CAMPEP_0174929246 /NCGR_PEP_ID=MMETSP1355-20121228/27098_1 /TAXON_ID=464990 /ORGANISM="Hemiselmis tepida, Strain CCMP443" /LENGTH=439 /DNA_ID=CAMNT_0016175439 /DNA_START=11 /DNA_END=1330 /DNA_ORIENTATION=-